MSRFPKSFSTVAFRLSAGFAALMSIMALVAGLSVVEMSQRGQQVRTIVDVNNAKTALGNAMLVHIDEMSVHARAVLLMTDLAEIGKEVGQYKAATAAYLDSEGRMLAALQSGGADAAACSR
jgi:hypothetical protein